MRVWGGIQRERSDVGGGHLTACGGLVFDVEGELRRRSGLENILDLSAAAMGTFAPASGGPQIVIMQGDGNVNRMIVGTESSVSIDTDYDTTYRPNFGPANARLYYTNDYDRVQVYDGVADATDAGIVGPGVVMGTPTESTGSVTAGTHLIRYRYVNAEGPVGDGYGYRSDPSLEEEYTVTGSASDLIFSMGTATTNDIIVPTTGQSTVIRVEMTPVDSITFYEVGEYNFDVTSVTIDLSDDELVEQTLVLTATEDGHLQPPGCRCLATVGERSFYGGAHDHTLASVSVTSDSQTVTYAGMPTIWQSRNVRFGTDSKTYQISTVESATFTLVSSYEGSTSTDVTAIVSPADPNRVRYSHSYLPESVPALNGFDALSGTGDRLVAMSEHVSQLWLFGRRTTERRYWVQAGDPGRGDSVVVSREMGVWNQRCIVRVDDDTMYGWGPNGVWGLQGGRPLWISRPVDASWRELLDPDVDEDDAESFFGVYDSQRRTIVWLFREAGETDLLKSITLDVNGAARRWALDTRQLPLDCGVAASTSGGRSYAYLGSEDRGNIYRMNESWKLEGVTSSTDGIYTVAAGGDTLSTVVNESLPASGLVGASMYVPATGEVVEITANTTDTITHAALSSAATLGTPVYAGTIPIDVTTAWFIETAVSNKSTLKHVLIEVAAADDAPICVLRYYQNYGTTPMPITNPMARALPKGVEVGADGTSFNLDFSSAVNNGSITVPTPSNWNRSFRASLTIYQPGTVRILDIKYIVSASKRGSDR